MALAFWVGLGGFIGSVLRYLIVLGMRSQGWTGYPLGTLTVNILGSLAIGIALSMGQARLGNEAFHFIVPGILGGFTTYSAFAGETLAFLYAGRPVSAFLYVGAMSVVCLVGAALGYEVGRHV